MYIIYESYIDETKNIKNTDNNTKIIRIIKNEENALQFIEKYMEDTITNNEKEFDWFYKELEKDLLDNEDIIKVYEVFNGEIGNYNEFYRVVLEKVEILSD